MIPNQHNRHDLTLMAFRSAYIVQWLTRHPINWLGMRGGELAKRHGIGDTAGYSPTPAVAEFLRLLSQRQDLFTQQDYWLFCQEAWGEWLLDKTREQVEGVRAKCYRNFYPSLIDQLHAWALLSETGLFDRCLLDSLQDSTGDSDLTLVAGSKTIRVAIFGPGRKAIQDRAYKTLHRSHTANRPVEVQIPLSRPRTPGNKRWLNLDDLAPVLALVQNTGRKSA